MNTLRTYRVVSGEWSREITAVSLKVALASAAMCRPEVPGETRTSIEIEYLRDAPVVEQRHARRAR
jgi:hypothetical protein